MQSLFGETILSNFDLVQGLLGGDFGLMLDRRAVEDPLVSCFEWRLLSARMDSYVTHYILDNEKAVAKVSIAQSLNSEEELDEKNRRRWSKVWIAGAPELGKHVDATRTFFGSFCDSPTHFDHSVGYLPSAFLLSMTLSTSAALFTSPFLFFAPLFLLALPSPSPPSYFPSPSQALSFTLLSYPSS